MANSRWTVIAGRTLCFDGREIATLQRVETENAMSEIAPSDLDDLAREIAYHLSASDRVVRHPYHAQFCQRCGVRNMTPGRACGACGHAIMGPAFKSARKR